MLPMNNEPYLLLFLGPNFSEYCRWNYSAANSFWIFRDYLELRNQILIYKICVWKLNILRKNYVSRVQNFVIRNWIKFIVCLSVSKHKNILLVLSNFLHIKHLLWVHRSYKYVLIVLIVLICAFHWH